MFNYQAGVFVPAQWQPQGGNTSVLNIYEHTLDLSILLIDVTSSGSGGTRARIGGPVDAAGTINTSFDLDQAPWSPELSISPGIRGIASFGVSPTRFIQVPSRVEKLHLASARDREVQQSFDVKCDALTGLIVYPPL